MNPRWHRDRTGEIVEEPSTEEIETRREHIERARRILKSAKPPKLTGSVSRKARKR